MSYSSKPDAAIIALNAHTKARGLDDENDIGIGLYHLLNSILELCDARGIDFDEELSILRSDISADRATETTKHPFRYDHTSLMGVERPAPKGRR